MEYIKKISQDEYEYFQEESKRICEAQDKLKKINKKYMFVLFLAIFILIVFFNENSFYFSFFILASLSYSIWFLEKQLMLLLEKQSSLNELMIKTINKLALDNYCSNKYRDN